MICGSYWAELSRRRHVIGKKSTSSSSQKRDSAGRLYNIVTSCAQSLRLVPGGGVPQVAVARLYRQSRGTIVWHTVANELIVKSYD